MLRRHADPVFHETSQTDRPGFAFIPDEAPLHISRSKNVRHVVAPGVMSTRVKVRLERSGVIVFYW